VRLELHAEDLAGQALDVVDRLGDLDAAALAPAAGVDLCLHHPDRAAEFLRGFHRLLHGERRDAARHGHAEAAQDLLALVLVNLHGMSLEERGWCTRCWRSSGQPLRGAAANCIMVHRTNRLPRHERRSRFSQD
jgi:hypothetical protein